MTDDVAEHLRRLGLPEHMVQRHLNRGLDKPSREAPPEKPRQRAVGAASIEYHRKLAQEAWPLIDKGLSQRNAAKQLHVSEYTLGCALRLVPRPKIKRIRLVR